MYMRLRVQSGTADAVGEELCIWRSFLLSIAPMGKVLQPRVVIRTLGAVKAGSFGIIKEQNPEERREGERTVERKEKR